MIDYVEHRVEALFGPGKFMCAETVLTVIAEMGGEDPSKFVRLATGFCSGVSRTCGQCGAVSGAVMGIGLFAGRTTFEEDVDPAYHLIQELLDRFKSKYASINCFELINCDFATPEGQAKFKEDGLLTNCREFAVFTASTALELLREEGYIEEERAMLNSQLGPCGLSCGQCLAYRGGPIQRLSEELGSALGENFSEYAKRFEGMNPVFRNYEGFKELLEFFASGSCGGCREKGCMFKDCKVTLCVREHGVDFCFQCAQFPCERHGMPEGLAQRWQKNNETMKKVGIPAWFTGCRNRPRYP